MHVAGGHEGLCGHHTEQADRRTAAPGKLILLFIYIGIYIYNTAKLRSRPFLAGSGATPKVLRLLLLVRDFFICKMDHIVNDFFMLR